MRPRHPPAAESGVGKHTARESERVQACAAGKERVTHAHPQIWPSGPQGSGGLIFSAFARYRETRPSVGGRRPIPSGIAIHDAE